MKQFNKLHKIFATRLTVLLAVLFGNAGLVLADNTVSIADFEIKAGETKEIAVELTNTSDVRAVEGVIDLPYGLELVSYSARVHSKPAARVSGIANMNPTTGAFSVMTSSSKVAFQGNSGAFMTFKVKATEEFTTSQIEFKDLQVKLMDGTKENAKSTPALVVLADGQADDPDDPDTPLPGENSIAFAKSTVKIPAGGTAEVELKLTNGDEFTGVSGYLYLEADNQQGISIAEVKKSSRLAGELRFTPETGRFSMLGNISGNTGAIMTVVLKASESFEGIAYLGTSQVRFSTAAAEAVPVENASTVIASSGAFVPEATFAYGSESLALAPGESVDVPVTVESNAEISGFTANLVLPEGITAAVKKGSLLASDPTYTSTNGNISYLGSIDGTEGELFILTLTAANTFEGGNVTLAKLIATTPSANSIKATDITLAIKAKNPADLAEVLGWVDGLQEKLNNTIAKIEKEYPEAAKDEDLLRDEQIIQQGIVDLHGDVQEAYDNGTLNPDDFKGTVKELSDAIDALEATAKEIQDKEGNKDNEAGKAALDDEIAALQKKLDDAKDEIPSDLPKDATKELSDDADAIQNQIDDLKAKAEKDYEDGKLTPDSKLDPEKKQKVLDDIDALLAKIKTWLRGDVDNDGDVDMEDFYALKKLISEEKTPTDAASNFFYRCDANADGEINAGDLQGILNICVGLKANGK